MVKSKFHLGQNQIQQSSGICFFFLTNFISSVFLNISYQNESFYIPQPSLLIAGLNPPKQRIISGNAYFLLVARDSVPNIQFFFSFWQAYFPPFFFFFTLFIYLFIYFGCIGSPLLRVGFLQFWRVGATLLAVRGLLVAVASFVAEHGLQVRGLQQLRCMGLVVVAHGLSSCGLRALERRLSSCGTRVQLLCGMWDLPGPGIKPVSPALAGGFLTTVPPGKSLSVF